MSTQMPTLFDDEDFFVPPPKKETKAKKNIPAAKEQLPEEDIFGTNSENPTEINEVENIEDAKTLVENNTINKEDTVLIEDNISSQTEASETNENETGIDFDTEIESASDIIPDEQNDSQVTSSGISFEIPEEPEIALNETEAAPSNFEPLPIPGVREDVVDDLDQLLRTEIIAQDYTAFSAFQFESTLKKNEQNEIDEEPIEKTTISIKDLEPENLDFDLADVNDTVTALPEFQLEDKYYSIGEVADLFAVNVSHIRFWTTEFKLKVRTTRKGDRLYNPENIARLRLIHHLVKENKYTIKGAKEQLKTQQKTLSQQVDLKDKLSGLKEKLERIKRNL